MIWVLNRLAVHERLGGGSRCLTDPNPPPNPSSTHLRYLRRWLLQISAIYPHLKSNPPITRNFELKCPKLTRPLRFSSPAPLVFWPVMSSPLFSRMAIPLSAPVSAHYPLPCSRPLLIVARTLVRSTSKGEYLSGVFHSDKFSYAVIPDMGEDDAFDEVLEKENFDAVEHVASPFYVSDTCRFDAILLNLTQNSSARRR